MKSAKYRALVGGNLKDGTRFEAGDVLDVDDEYGQALVAMGIAEELS